MRKIRVVAKKLSQQFNWVFVYVEYIIATGEWKILDAPLVTASHLYLYKVQTFYAGDFQIVKHTVLLKIRREHRYHCIEVGRDLIKAEIKKGIKKINSKFADNCSKTSKNT